MNNILTMLSAFIQTFVKLLLDMLIDEVLKNAINNLRKCNIDLPVLKARIVLADLLNVRKEDLIIREKEPLPPEKLEKYFENIDKLCNNVPLQYVTGKQEFMGDMFVVNENVLVPRADTEILVEEAIKYAKGDVLELCTGSGIIAISMAKRCNANITATDISEKALEVAKINASKHNVDINFIKSDLFERINGKYNLIVANPPYIETETIKKLEEQVKKEPFIALNGGKDGLTFYKRIAQEAYKFLNKGGYLCLEIGYNQRDRVTNLLQTVYSDVRCLKDLSGNDRVIVCQWKG